MLNTENIKAALTLVHTLERTSENPRGLKRLAAFEYAVKNGPCLNPDEIKILQRALSLD